jgi:hypothetical protein
VREFLFVSRGGAVACGEEEVALVVKDQTRAKALAAGTVEGGSGFEDLLLIDECTAKALAGHPERIVR